MWGLLRNGVFGNVNQLFPTIEAAQASRASCFGVRVLNQVGVPNLPVGFSRREMRSKLREMVKRGFKPSDLIIDEANDPNQVTANMEIMLTSRGLYVRASFERLRMRDALAKGTHHFFGLRASELVKHFMSPCSYTNLQRLLDLWPDHVVECTSHRVMVGDVPGNNTFFWEVRDY